MRVFTYTHRCNIQIFSEKNVFFIFSQKNRQNSLFYTCRQIFFAGKVTCQNQAEAFSLCSSLSQVCIVHDLPDRVVIAQELANNLSLAKELVSPSCHLSVNLLTVLASDLSRVLARGPCHCKTCRKFLVIAME